MTRRCECGKAMGAGSFRCLACSRRTPAVDPTPEEIAALKWAIRWGGVEITNASSRRPRIKPTGPRGGILCVSDDEERAWRASQQEDESEVGE